jgi:Methyltransferase domain
MKINSMFIRSLRHHFVRPFDDLPLRGVGAEIGVFKGEHAASMLKRHPIDLLYCVDPYSKYNECDDDRVQARNSKEALERLRRFYGRHKFIVGTTATLARECPPLDFIYFDGDHTKEGVRSDLTIGWPLVKSGGIIGGHDFHSDPTHQGVIDAVVEFVYQRGLQLHHTTGPDWWVYKP